MPFNFHTFCTMIHEDYEDIMYKEMTRPCHFSQDCMQRIAAYVAPSRSVETDRRRFS
jgi:hypothetical protein